jgi:hypothetical protein
MAYAGGPVKAAKLFRAAISHLHESQRAAACFVNAFAIRSRSGVLECLTYRGSGGQ